ncbi:hypothetical protein HQ865_13040 [Mucilaginibacter mali]|uniref:Wax synthase domain-containing protein n=1 Tax=Mucilaginibacter mali TaxID=2740462 RepID=A0A7D4UDJ1_9SPHI|nr:MBOAT family protein [Mucilaginibacter mali]QKJ30639.1 hypothetical protein HQ865_13040 [Mucilaginibacter mali]
MITTLMHLSCFGLINLLIAFAGYPILKHKLIWLSWLVLVISILSVHFIFLNEYPIIRMLALIATTFTAMKVIAATEEYRYKTVELTFKQWFIFATAWAGMRAQPFETLGGPPLPNAWPMVRFGITRLIAGLILVLLARQIATLSIDATLKHILVSAILLIGYSLMLHFGILSISAGMWRFHGANTYFLFKAPAKATSLTDFWSKRWNIAFSEMTAIAIFRPLRNKIGSAAALMLAFAFSGLLHELALSIPVNHGYGLPMLYFIIHGVLVLFEKALISRRILFLKNIVVARVWVFFWLIAPSPLLFHIHFIREIVWPLAGLKF